MSYDVDDTIAAIATAAGGAARGIVRVSGPDAVLIVGRCFSALDGRRLEGLRRTACITGVVHVDLGWHAVTPGKGRGQFTMPFAESLGRATDVVPCDLFVWPTARSYTRQPIAELHTLGSPPLLDAVLAAVCAAGARLAEPGEFTLRAFLAGRIDLTQAEAVLGVIDARSQDELTSSLAQLAGGLARLLATLRDELLQLLAELEAGLDFVEEDIEFISPAALAERLRLASAQLQKIDQQMASRLTASDAEQVVLLGLPNVGKSSLFNALVARFGAQFEYNRRAAHAALVSPERGTTRDYLSATLTFSGARCELIDTAGVDEPLAHPSFNREPTATDLTGGHSTVTAGSGLNTSACPISTVAQQLSGERRARGGIRLWCSDTVDAADRPPDCDVVVLTKSDIVQRPAESRTPATNVPAVVVSSHTGAGLSELGNIVRTFLMRETASRTGPVVAATAERCRESVRLAESAVNRAQDLVHERCGDELVAAEIRGAITELGKVVGVVYTDDLLDRIFSNFCVGK